MCHQLSMTSYNRQRVEGVSTKAQATAAITAVGHRGNSHIMQLNAMRHENWGYLRLKGRTSIHSSQAGPSRLALEAVGIPGTAGHTWDCRAYLGLQGVLGLQGIPGTAGPTHHSM